MNNLISLFENKNATMGSRKTDPKRRENCKSFYEPNSEKFERLKKLTEIRRPANKQKFTSEQSTEYKFNSLPRNLRKKNLSHFNGDDVHSGGSSNCSNGSIGNRYHSGSDVKHDILGNETVFVNQRIQAEEKDIEKSVEEFGEKLKKRRSFFYLSMENESNSPDFENQSSKISNLQVPVINTEVKDLQVYEEDIFGFNTFDEDEDDNYVVETYNREGEELVILTLEITRRNINKKDEINDDILYNSDYVVYNNINETTSVNYNIYSESSFNNVSSNESTTSESTTTESEESGRNAYTLGAPVFSDNNNVVDITLLGSKNYRIQDDGDEVCTDIYAINGTPSRNDDNGEEACTFVYTDTYSTSDPPSPCNDNSSVRSDTDNLQQEVDKIITYSYNNNDNYSSTNKNYSSGNFSTFENIDVDTNSSKVTIVEPYSPKPEKIHYILEELIQTEQLYISGLQMVIDQYKPYLEKHTPQDLIGRTAYLFGNIGEIYKNSKKFLNSMRSNEDSPEKIAQLFIDSASEFELYPLYSKNKPTADIYLRQFDKVIKERERMIEDKLGLASYLLTPIQRLGKYVLLLEQIEKELKKMTETPVEKITAAVNVVRNVMRKGNDYIAIDSIKDSPIDLTSKGSFIMRAPFNILKPRKFSAMVFLFENIVVFTENTARNLEQFKYVESIPMNELTLAKVELKPTIFHLENFTKKKKAHPDATFVLEAETPKIKKEWTEIITDKLWIQLTNAKEQQQQGKTKFAEGKHSPRTVPRSERKVNKSKPYRMGSKGKSKFYDHHNT